MEKKNNNNSKGVWITLKNGIRIKIEPKKKEAREGAKKKLNSNNNNNNSLGPEYKGYKGKKAIDKLLKEKKGYIKGAFHRKDIGDIDLAWGNNKMGLKHIIKRRKETRQNLEEVLENIPDVIEKGKLRKNKSKSKKKSKRYVIEQNGYRVIVTDKFDEENPKMIITAFEIYK